MTRQLRPRKAKPSYLLVADRDEASDASPGETSRMNVDDDGSSGSEFSPENNKDVAEQTQQAEEEAEESTPDDKVEFEVEESPMNLITDMDLDVIPLTSTSKAKGKGKAPAKKGNGHPSLGPSLTKTRRQMYTLPTPSTHHRHRAIPLYRRDGRAERLKQRPELFRAPSIVMTNGISNDKVMERVNKAWGYNVGSGPLWEMAEDRGWFKEAELLGNGGDLEAERRPVVHSAVRVKNGWRILTKEEAAPYLPSDTSTTEEGNLRPPPPLKCYFGPYDEQTLTEIHILEARSMSEFVPESQAHIFNPGAPAWGLDWCPIHRDDRPKRGFKQYLAVAPFPTSSHSPEIGAKVSRPSYSCIQIWSLSSPESNSSRAAGSRAQNSPKMQCEMILCIESGPAHDLKWCPPSQSTDVPPEAKKPRKLGLLAGTFEDGSLTIYAVPEPEDMQKTGRTSLPVYVKVSEPLVRISLEETSCWSLDWANSEMVAIGTTNGIIAVYNVGTALELSTAADSPTITDLLPTHYITAHQSAIRALAWIRAPSGSTSGVRKLFEDPTVIASGAYDGMECLTDIRTGRASVMNRTRDVISTMSYSPYGGGPVTIDHENIVKSYSASPSMLGRGHMLLEPQGPVWSVSSSEWHPQLGVGSADGSCLTTNLLRSTRRSGSIPFFVHKVYQMDFKRKTGEFRMLDQFLPQESADRPTAASKAKQQQHQKSKKDTSTSNDNTSISTGAWPQEVAVHKVTWNNGNGLNACGLLASATSSGLCRVDNVWGRWMKDKVPYGGIEQIRREEMEDGMDVDSGESDSE
ncbi:hypothetical protein AGABI2DRAFT_114796 [Agaricus bisporus var. bisporus H97]|uniref:hypothetical protein n=1 Tax=Agaricus bisporus var. bisporus (strain H97 / ATCC MYA-4626 / FGSC 10389) TaxID=936046 RepID=UPI00029F5E32|nr:hypothetical protein AGABI2DRAFT_114796 [Agaricus bisporus var. bisporus H97]EKV49707.1 hypothetical protein AGABI2DRAFT_114796 [Agaricus bisporus var. bisporus H97]